MALHWPVPELQQALRASLPDCAVEVLASVDSTNTELMRRARAASLVPTLLVAERQTAGRGRLGRNWHSHADGPADGRSPAPGALPSLTFSFGMPLAPLDWSGLSLAVGVGVARALHPALGLKWPNDLWFQDRKLAGILIETAAASTGADGSRFVVVGVGINIAPRDPAGLSTAPACLRELLPELDAPAVLARVAPPLVQALRLFEAQGFAAFHAEFDRRDVLRGRVVQLSDGLTGTAGGVDGRGALLVHTSAGMKLVNSAEVSVRPVPARHGDH
ncbi:biotin--[acetyl-CoA-carboxylase] ligase [Comamonadaceae bacterium G21597-S1]|nr:biotin--[acetyl-CoA-carboxylase] ligase [Comamonadaceae bacterium G21597-S1]